MLVELPFRVRYSIDRMNICTTFQESQAGFFHRQTLFARGNQRRFAIFGHVGDVRFRMGKNSGETLLLPMRSVGKTGEQSI